MARNIQDFEDKVSADWPDEVQELARAAIKVYSAMAALDELQNEARTDGDGLPLLPLAGDAYKLLRDIRAEGERRLAAWERAQEGGE